MTVANVQILLKRGNTAASSTYIGPLGELTLDTTTYNLRVHNGTTPGGIVANVALVGYINHSNTTTRAYIDGQITAANAGVTLANTIQSAQISAANIGIIGYIGNAVTSANVGLKGYVDSKIAANVAALVNSAPGVLDTLNELAAALNNDASFSATITNIIASTNSNVTIANTNMRGYVDGQITSGNAAVTLANTIQSAQISAANIGMLGHVNNINTTLTSNAATQSDLIIGINANVSLANTTMKGYVDGQVSAANGAATLANTIVTAGTVSANLGMRGYVDSVANQSIYGNANVTAYLITNGIKSSILYGNVAFGFGSGFTNQGSDAVAVGYAAGQTSQGGWTVAIGQGAASDTQGEQSVAVGHGAGQTLQGVNAVSIGYFAGRVNQGNNAVAIGYLAGYSAQSANSIVINSSSDNLFGNLAGLYINPIRRDDSNTANIAYYNTTTKELSHGPAYGNVQVNPLITAANVGVVGYVVLANTTMKGYVDGQITAANAGVTLANTIVSAGIVSANVGVVGYVVLANTTMKGYVDGQITAANGSASLANTIVSAGVVSANLGMKGYVDNINTTLTSNAATQSDLIIGINANVTLANTTIKGYVDGQVSAANGSASLANTIVTAGIVSANVGIIGYIGLGNSTTRSYIDGQINAANAGVTTANLGMIGYVNSVASQSIYGNANVTAYTVTMGFTNFSNVNVASYISSQGITSYSNVQVETYLPTHSGNIAAGNGTVSGYSIGYRDVPQISAGNITLGAIDGGKHYYSTATAPTTLTIPSNANVAFATGTAITIINAGTGNISIAKQVEVSLYMAGNSTSAARTLTSYGMATVLKTATNQWFINGTGVAPE